MLVKTYKRLMDISPRIPKLKGDVFRLKKGIILEGKSNAQLQEIAEKIAKAVRRFPFNKNIQAVVFCMKDNPPPMQVEDDEENKRKNEFLRQEHEKLLKRVTFRKRERFFVVQEEESSAVKELSSLPFLEFEKGNKEFNRCLAYFFGGNEEDPVWYPIERWDYGVKIGDRYGAVLMDLKVPAEASIFIMDVLNYINEDFIFCLNFRIPPPFEIEKSLSSLKTLLAKQAENDPAMREILSEIMEVQKELELEREKLVFSTATLTVFADSAREAEEKARELSRKLAQYGLRYEIEGTVEFQAFMQLFRWNEKWCHSVNLVRRYISDAFSQFLPLTVLMKGAKKGRGMLFINSGQEAVYIDFYEVMPPNAIVLGQMGAGKSVISNYMGLSVDMITFLEKIQEGEGSYKNFVEFMSGGYFPIAKARPKALTPFGTTLMSIDEISFVEDLGYSFEEFTDGDLVLMKEVLNANFFSKAPVELTKEEVLSAFEKYPRAEYIRYKLETGKWKNGKWAVKYTEDKDKLSTIQTLLSLMLDLGGVEADSAEVGEIVRTTYQRKAEANNGLYAKREVLMSDFVETAQSMRKDKIAMRLSAYTMKGVYGHFFDRPTKLSFNRHMFFELREKDEELLPVIVMSILTNMVKFYSRPEFAHLKKGILLDEAWLFINHPLIVGWLEEAIRTYRKKGIFIVLASQLAKDFTSGAGEFLRDNSPYKFFLFSQEHAKIKEAFELTDGEYEILKTIKRPKDYGYKYSKFYCITPYNKSEEKGVLYFIPSRVFYWLTTTDPADRQKREEYKNRYKDMFRAILELAKEDEGK